MNKIGARLAVAALAGGMLVVGYVPAIASAAPTPKISIAAKSKLTGVTKATGYVLVVYSGGKFGKATITMSSLSIVPANSARQRSADQLRTARLARSPSCTHSNSRSRSQRLRSARR
jgi:hypothetical protein